MAAYDTTNQIPLGLMDLPWQTAPDALDPVPHLPPAPGRNGGIGDRGPTPSIEDGIPSPSPWEGMFDAERSPRVPTGLFEGWRPADLPHGPIDPGGGSYDPSFERDPDKPMDQETAAMVDAARGKDVLSDLDLHDLSGGVKTASGTVDAKGGPASMGVFDKAEKYANKWFDKDKDGAFIDDLFGLIPKKLPVVGDTLAPAMDDLGDYLSDYMGTRSRPNEATTDDDYKPGKYEELPGGGYGEKGGYGTSEAKETSGPLARAGKVLGGLIGGSLGAPLGAFGIPLGAIKGAHNGGDIGNEGDHAIDGVRKGLDDWDPKNLAAGLFGGLF